MKKIFYCLIVVFSVVFVSGCDFGDSISPGSQYYNPFYRGNRIEYDGYTYTNNSGSSVRNLSISFTSLGAVGYVGNNYAYGIVDSTFSYTSQGYPGNLVRLDTLYFAAAPNGDIQFLSYGYYRIIPRWIDLFRFSYLNNTYTQNFDEVIDDRRWTLQIDSYLTRTNIYTGFGNLPVYRLEQRLRYSAPFNTDITFMWYWSEEYGLMVYDEQRNGLIYQVAQRKNF
jgi:hypothetical protein